MTSTYLYIFIYLESNPIFWFYPATLSQMSVCIHWLIDFVNMTPQWRVCCLKVALNRMLLCLDPKANIDRNAIWVGFNRIHSVFCYWRPSAILRRSWMWMHIFCAKMAKWLSIPDCWTHTFMWWRSGSSIFCKRYLCWCLKTMNWILRSSD